MDEADLAALEKVGKGLCVFSFCFLYRGIPNLTNVARLALKVVLQTPNSWGTERKLTHVQLQTVIFYLRELPVDIRLFLNARRRGQVPCIFLDPVSGSDRRIDKVCLVWKEILE